MWVEIKIWADKKSRIGNSPHIKYLGKNFTPIFKAMDKIDDLKTSAIIDDYTDKIKNIRPW